MQAHLAEIALLDGADEGSSKGAAAAMSRCSVSASDARDGTAELRAVQKKELDEVRSLHKPPMVVRRSLELVHALLHAADSRKGAECAAVLQPPSWAALQAVRGLGSPSQPAYAIYAREASSACRRVLRP